MPTHPRILVLLFPLWLSGATNTITSWDEIRSKWQDAPLIKIEQAAESGDHQAQHYLGRFHSDGIGGETNLVEGLKWYRRAAEAGFPNSQNNLGNAYLRGLGVEVDVEQAERWYRKAADQGEPVAICNLAELLARNKGQAAEGREMLETAARHGNLDAMVRLGSLLSASSPLTQSAENENALYWYEKAHFLGKKGICASISRFYDTGWTRPDHSLIGQNVARAVEWLKEGARERDSECEFLLGNVFLHGEFAERNVPEALRLLKLATEGGNAGGQITLARILDGTDPHGAGAVPKDLATARDLYLRAARKGYADGAYGVAQLAFRHNDDSDQTEALRWLWMAVDKRNPNAVKLLIDLLDSGLAKPRTPTETPIALLEQARREGMPFARLELALRYGEGKGVPKDTVLSANFLFETLGSARGIPGQVFETLDLVDFELNPRKQATAELDERAALTSLFLKAVYTRDASAAESLGKAYLEGRKLPKDASEACAWFAYAATLGSSKAEQQKNQLVGQLDEAQVAEIKTRPQFLDYIRRQIRWQVDSGSFNLIEVQPPRTKQ